MKTTLLVVAPRPIPPGQVILPDPLGPQQTVPPGMSVVELAINLALADKLAAGKTLTLASYFSTDAGASWRFINGFDWTSYGPGGFTAGDPGGATRINPDPLLHTPLNGLTGNLVRAVLTFNASFTAGLTLSAF